MNQKILLFAAMLTILTSCCKSDDNDTAPIVIAGNVTTLAGSEQGDTNGTGAAAQFFYPMGLFIDRQGDLLVADFQNHKIKKITQAGVVTTILGSVMGDADGDIATATFNTPSDIATDAAGNTFICDRGNHRIRKITPAGNISTFAGSTFGYADGIGTAAKFTSPSVIYFDKQGMLYVVDNNGHKIRKITPAGAVTTVAGSNLGDSDGLGTAAQFNYPHALCIDSQNNIYVTDYYNHKIKKINPAGEVTTFAGATEGSEDGTLATARFKLPRGITIDPQDNLYIADTGNAKIRKIATDGTVTTIAGSTPGFSDGLGSAAQFHHPSRILYHEGKLYVADSYNNRIRIIE